MYKKLTKLQNRFPTTLSCA